MCDSETLMAIRCPRNPPKAGFRWNPATESCVYSTWVDENYAPAPPDMSGSKGAEMAPFPGVLALIVLIPSVVCCCCCCILKRARRWRHISQARMQAAGRERAVVQRVDVNRFPTMIMAEDTVLANQITDCSVCLEEFVEGHEIRVLPCKHPFHKECIDQWLRTQISCPLCMQSLLEVHSEASSSPDRSASAEALMPGGQGQQSLTEVPSMQAVGAGEPAYARIDDEVEIVMSEDSEVVEINETSVEEPEVVDQDATAVEMTEMRVWPPPQSASQSE